MKITTLILAMVAALNFGLSSAAQTGETKTLVMRAERGDTFSNLFGRDWQKAFEQNRIVVWRNGAPISTPDILIEGATLSVTDDVELTPRALERIETIRTARRALLAQIEVLERKTGGGAVTTTITAELRRAVLDDVRFGADLAFLERRVAQLASAEPPVAERITPALQAKLETGVLPWMIALLVLAALSVGYGYAVLATRTGQISGAARFDSAWSDLERTLDRFTG